MMYEYPKFESVCVVRRMLKKCHRKKHKVYGKVHFQSEQARIRNNDIVNLTTKGYVYVRTRYGMFKKYYNPSIKNDK